MDARRDTGTAAPRPWIERLAASFAGVLEPSSSTRVIWRSLALLHLAAGAIVLLTLQLGVDPEADEGALTALAVSFVAAAGLLHACAARIPASWVGAALLAALAGVSGLVVASGESDTPYALLYVWVGVEAWFFLRARHAVALTTGTLVASGVAMAIVSEGDGDARAWWVTVAGSLLAVSLFAGILHGRARRLIDRLGDAAVRDALTGLLNRRGYQQRLAEELARARRYGTPLSIVVGDLDQFKALNDRFGHRAGDAALEAFAAIARRDLRDVDFVARVGGEEFAVVLPSTAEAGAILAAERLRRAVRAELRTPAGAPVTASFGVATFPQHGADAEVLLDHADQAMYAAKRLGRDRTVGFAPELPSPEQPGVLREHLQAVMLLAESLDSRPGGTPTHAETVAGLAADLARMLGLDADGIARVRLGGLLHDVGMIAVPDAALHRAGPLTPDERAVVERHPELGARIVESAGLPDVAAWVLAHHERPDGTGYPRGLAGERIALEARILAVADAYQAMTTGRPYRPALSGEAALAELERAAGTQFDPVVVRALAAGAGAPATAGVP